MLRRRPYLSSARLSEAGLYPTCTLRPPRLKDHACPPWGLSATFTSDQLLTLRHPSLSTPRRSGYWPIFDISTPPQNGTLEKILDLQHPLPHPLRQHHLPAQEAHLQLRLLECRLLGQRLDVRLRIVRDAQCVPSPHQIRCRGARAVHPLRIARDRAAAAALAHARYASEASHRERGHPSGHGLFA